MIRPLNHLARIERHILQKVKDQYRYQEWEKRGKPPSASFFPPQRVFLSKEERKPQKTNKLMVLMIHVQLNQCVLCGSILKIDDSLRSDHPDRPSFDHVVSKAKGGQNKGNRIAVHRQCNSIKSNRDPTGCELIWLMVVNYAIEYQQKSWQQNRKGC